MRIPARGKSKDDVLAAVESFRAQDVPWRGGKLFAYVYDAGRDVEEVGKRAYTAYLSENGLDVTAFPSLLKMENDVIAMARAHLRGGDDVVGSFTSGGTESIILACKTARDFMMETRGITAPEMVFPTTAHAAFHKAAHYLGIKVVTVDVDPGTFRAVPQAMAAAINANTVLMVGSAPSYAHGVIDPIRELAAVAAQKGLPFHVDGCIGGFVLPYFKRLGQDVEDFDFSVPGVWSISMDLHKYAYCPKGASVVLYKDKDYRRHQIFACSQWTGYTMVNPTVQSSRTGGPVAAAWAVMNFLGEDGYLRLAEGLLSATRRVVEGLGSIAGLRVLGKPAMCLVAFAADGASVFHLADEMKERGWHIHPQMAFGSSPQNLHLTVQPSNVPHVDALLKDLQLATDAARALESGAGEQMAAFIRQKLEENPGPAALNELMGMVGASGDGGLPGRMAVINEILNALPRHLSEVMVREFVNMMFTPTR